MNLAQVIHQRWAAAAGLNDLLPTDRVFTGMSFDPSLPFATIGKESDRPTSYQSDGSAVDTVSLRIRVFHEHHADAAAIVHQIKTAFDRTAFDLAGSDKVLIMQRVNDFEQQRDDGAWQMVVDFNCTVYLAAGV